MGGTQKWIQDLCSTVKNILNVFLMLLVCLNVGDLVRYGERSSQRGSISAESSDLIERTSQLINKILVLHHLKFHKKLKNAPAHLLIQISL